MAERPVRHHIRQTTFRDDGRLFMLIAIGYVDDAGNFVELKSFDHEMSPSGLAAFFGGSPDASLQRVQDMTNAMNAYLLGAGVIDVDVV